MLTHLDGLLAGCQVHVAWPETLSLSLTLNPAPVPVARPVPGLT